MKLSDEEVRRQVTVANERMVRKFKVIGVIIALTFFVCVAFDGPTNAVAHWAAAYVPSVAKLFKNPTSLGTMPARFFGVVAVLVPALAIWLAWGEDVRTRWRYGQMRSGRGPTESLLMVYLLGVPFSVFVLFVMYAAPIDMPAQPRLWGQHIVYLMHNTYLGLLILGGIATFSTALFAAVLVFCFWLPVSSIKSLISKGSK